MSHVSQNYSQIQTIKHRVKRDVVLSYTLNKRHHYTILYEPSINISGSS